MQSIEVIHIDVTEMLKEAIAKAYIANARKLMEDPEQLAKLRKRIDDNVNHLTDIARRAASHASDKCQACQILDTPYCPDMDTVSWADNLSEDDAKKYLCLALRLLGDRLIADDSAQVVKEANTAAHQAAKEEPKVEAAAGE